MKILIINLTRMGDILQTGPLLFGLKQRDPQAEIFYLADCSFAAVLDNLPGIDHKLTINFKELLSKVVSGKDNLVENFSYLQSMLSIFDGQSFDLVINLTHTDESKVLTWLARGKETVGITMDEFGYRVVRHPWENYFYCSNLNRAINRINLVDIYLRMGNLSSTPGRLFFELPLSLLEQESAILSSYGLESRYFCIQLGASVENKQYPPEKFAEVANLLYQSLGLQTVFVGTESELPLLRRAEKVLNHQSVNLLGKTSINQLGLVLKKTQFLLTNDTGTMHVAAGVECRIFCIALATAYSHETAAYGAGNIIFEAEIACTPCSHHVVCLNAVCKNYISPQVISSVIVNYKQIISGEQKINYSGAEKMKIFKTGFDAEGYLRLFPLTTATESAKEIFNRAYHYLWIKSLGFVDYQVVKTNHDFNKYAKSIKAELTQYYQKTPADKISFDLLRYISDLNWLQNVARQAKEHTLKMKNCFTSGDFNQLKTLAPELSEFDNTITNRGFTDHHLRPLTFYFQFDKDNMDTNDVGVLLDKTINSYDVLEFRCEFLSKLLILLK